MKLRVKDKKKEDVTVRADRRMSVKEILKVFGICMIYVLLAFSQVTSEPPVSFFVSFL
jgi:hypothetical protein